MINNNITSVKISEMKVQKYGIRGFALSLPKVFISDNKINVGSKIIVHRAILNNRDVLILEPSLDASQK